MARTVKTRITQVTIYLGVTVIVLTLLFAELDRRVDSVLEGARQGDIINVPTDVCNALRDRGVIETNTKCGYRRGSVPVRIIKTPE